MQSNIYIEKYKAKEQLKLLEADAGLLKIIKLKLDNIISKSSTDLIDTKHEIMDIFRLASRISIYNRWNFLAKLGLPWDLMIFTQQSNKIKSYEDSLVQDLVNNDYAELKILRDKFDNATVITHKSIEKLSILDNAIDNHYLKTLPLIEENIKQLNKYIESFSAQKTKVEENKYFDAKLLSPMVENIKKIKTMKIEEEKLQQQKQELEEFLDKIILTISSLPELEKAIAYPKIKQKIDEINKLRIEITTADLSTTKSSFDTIKKNLDSLSTDLSRLPKEEIKFDNMKELNTFLESLRDNIAELLKNMAELENPADIDKSIILKLSKAITGYNSILKLSQNITEDSFKSTYTNLLNSSMAMYFKCISSSISDKKIDGLINLLMQQKTDLSSSAIDYLYLIKDIQDSKLTPNAIITKLEDHDLDPLFILSCIDQNKQSDVLRRDLSAITDFLEDFNGKINIADENNISKLISRLSMLLQNHLLSNEEPTKTFQFLGEFLEFIKLTQQDLSKDKKIKYESLHLLWKVSAADISGDNDKNKLNFSSKQLVNFSKMVDAITSDKEKFNDDYKLFLVKLEDIKKLLTGKVYFQPYLEFINKFEQHLQEINKNLDNAMLLKDACKNFEMLMDGEKAIKDDVSENIPKQVKQEKTIIIESLKDAENLLLNDLMIISGMSPGKNRPEHTPPVSNITNLDDESLKKLNEIQAHLKTCELAKTKFSSEQQNYQLYSQLLNYFDENYRVLHESYKKRECHKLIADFYANTFDASKDKMKNVIEKDKFKNMTLLEVINYYKDSKNWNNYDDYKTSGVNDLIQNLEKTIGTIPHIGIQQQIYNDTTKAERQIRDNISNFIKKAVTALCNDVRRQYEGEAYQSTVEEFKQSLLTENILKILEIIKIDLLNLHKNFESSTIQYNIKCEIESIKKHVGIDFINQHIEYGYQLLKTLEKELISNIDNKNPVHKMALLRLIEIYGEFFKIISRNTISSLSPETSTISDLRNDLYHLGMEQYKGNILLRNFLGENVQENKGTYTDLTDTFRIVQQTINEIGRFKNLLRSNDEPLILRQLAAEFSVTYFGQFAHLLQDMPLFLEQATLLESTDNISLFGALTQLRQARGELAHQIQSVLSIYDNLFIPQTEIISTLGEVFDIKIPKMDNLTFVTNDVKSLLQLTWAMLKLGQAIHNDNDVEIKKIIKQDIDEFEAIFNIKDKVQNMEERISNIITQLDKCATSCQAFLYLKSTSIIKSEESKVSATELSKAVTPEPIKPITFQTYVRDLKKEKKHTAFVDYKQYTSKSKKTDNKKLNTSTSNIGSLSFIDFDQLAPKNTFNVSGLGNSCGLFSLAAGVKILCKSNSNFHINMNLTSLLNQIQLTELQNGSSNAHNLLRQQIYSALISDKTFKERRLHNFIGCCNQFLANKPTPSDMESFVCEPNNNKFMLILKKEWQEHLVKIEQIKQKHGDLLSDINNFEINPKDISTKLLAIKENLIKVDDRSCKDIINSIFKDCQTKDVGDFIALQKLYSAAWAQINEKDGSEQQRQLFNETFQEYFRERISKYLKKSDNLDINALYLLSLLINCQFNSEAKLMNKPTNIDILKEDMVSLFIEHTLSQKNNWNFCYENYCKHVGTQNVMLSADELGCLANYWRIPLEIKFNNRECYKTNSVLGANPGEMVSLCNVTRSHWEVALQPSMQQAVLELSEAPKKIITKDSQQLDESTSQKKFSNGAQ